MLGARPLRRALQRDIEDHLAEKILFSELKPGEIVVVDVADPGSENPFTFTGNPRTAAPDVPPVEFGGIIEGSATPRRRIRRPALGLLGRTRSGPDPLGRGLCRRPPPVG